ATEDLGIALAAVEGTGPRGRVTLDDVRRAVAAREDANVVPPAAAPAAPVLAPAPVLALAPDAGPDEQPLTATRRAIARRMSASQLIPQYQLQRDVDASHLLAQKAAQSAGVNAGARVGVNDLLVQAIAETVRRHPDLAVSWVDGDDGPRMVRSGADGVGLAAASDKGLVVPVIRDPQTAGLAAIAEQRQRLVGAARGGTLGVADMTGAAITLSNLGGFGVDRFTAMLNPGESAIVAVGRTVERVVPRRGGTAVIPVLAVTVSFDHRVIDGAVGAAALGTLAELLEGGMAWRP
ncbi:2-oxo acid dehydrogenase subunit E2, partial [Patulibacter sp. NPDC049589]|uniref:2-oxo acid dehydrogenase subunit E2 n=1 Tax=Patulibacter sp. NPDC049589 TaxID=3154731 RepID=UPI00343A07C6